MDIFENKEISNPISSYLSFNDKVNLYKTSNINLFRYYNFFDYNVKQQPISWLFLQMDSYAYNEYFSEVCCFSFHYAFDEILDEKYEETEKIEYLTNLFEKSYYCVYIRYMIEYIEDNYDKLNIEYDFEFDIVNYMGDIEIDDYIFENIINYYKSEMIKPDFDEEIFCYNCGKFGHVDNDKICIFHREKNSTS